MKMVNKFVVKLQPFPNPYSSSQQSFTRHQATEKQTFDINWCTNSPLQRLAWLLLEIKQKDPRGEEQSKLKAFQRLPPSSCVKNSPRQIKNANCSGFEGRRPWTSLVLSLFLQSSESESKSRGHYGLKPFRLIKLICYDQEKAHFMNNYCTLRRQAAGKKFPAPNLVRRRWVASPWKLPADPFYPFVNN